jgi:hypothetical protein
MRCAFQAWPCPSSRSTRIGCLTQREENNSTRRREGVERTAPGVAENELNPRHETAAHIKKHTEPLNALAQASNKIRAHWRGGCYPAPSRRDGAVTAYLPARRVVPPGMCRAYSCVPSSPHERHGGRALPTDEAPRIEAAPAPHSIRRGAPVGSGGAHAEQQKHFWPKRPALRSAGRGFARYLRPPPSRRHAQSMRDVKRSVD